MEQRSREFFGFDRLRFRGSLRALQSVRGMMGYLSRVHVLLRDFKDYVTAVSDRLRSQSQEIAQAAGRRSITSPAVWRARTPSRSKRRHAKASSKD